MTTQIPFLKRAMQTRTDVRDTASLRANSAKGYRNAYRTAAVTMAVAQYWLWTLQSLYGQAGRAGWIVAGLELIPIAGLWVLWSAAGTTIASGAKLLLLPCLLWDACAALRMACSVCAASLLTAWPTWLTAIVVGLFGWFCVGRCGKNGVALGLRQMAWILALLLAAVFLGTRPRAERLWPILGPGLESLAGSAVKGVGCGWTVALLFLLPKEAKGGGTLRQNAKSTILWVAAAWLIGALLALWLGLCMPWQAQGDQALLTLAWQCESPFLQQISIIALLALALSALAGCGAFAEHIAREAIPKAPKGLTAGLLLLLAVISGCFPAGDVLTVLAPYRATLALASGGLAVWQGRKTR